MNNGSSKGRLLAVGDIHGCLSTLRKLLQLVDPQDNDHFVFGSVCLNCVKMNAPPFFLSLDNSLKRYRGQRSA